MPTKTTDPTAVLTDALLSGMKQTQELALSGVSLWTDVAGKAFALAPFDALPGAFSLPNPREVVETSFGFAEEILATQKDFAVKFIETVTPKSAS